MPKKVLFIDDKARDTVFKALRLKAQRKGLSLELHQFNPGGAIEADLKNNETNELNEGKTLQRFDEKFPELDFDAIVCDWNLNSSNLNGLELLRKLCHHKPVLKKIPKMMYSGALDTELRKMIEDAMSTESEVEKNKKFDRFVKDLKLLAQAGFFAFSDRDEADEQLIPFLLKNEPLDLRLLKVLEDNPNLKFSVNCGGNYAGKTFKEVRDIIINDEEQEAKLLRDITEIAIAMLENKIAE